MPKDYVTINQFNDFKKETHEFRNAVFEQYEKQKEDHQRQIGAIIENNEHWAKFIVEAFHMDIERLERKFGLNDEEHKKFDERISRVEAATI